MVDYLCRSTSILMLLLAGCQGYDPFGETAEVPHHPSAAYLPDRTLITTATPAMASQGRPEGFTRYIV